MGNNRSKVPDLEKLVKGGRKKFVRYEEGAMLYSMGVHTFQQLAKDARAVYHVKRIVLVFCIIRHIVECIILHRSHFQLGTMQDDMP